MDQLRVPPRMIERAAERLRDELLSRLRPGEHREVPSCGRLLADLRAGRLAGLVFIDAPQTETWCQFIDGLRVPAVGALTPYLE